MARRETDSVAFTTLMGLSRIDLLGHYPSDILAGTLFGILCGLLTLSAACRDKAKKQLS